ncbi:MAG: TolC family protein [Phycisphaerales bacterium]|nr:TolC family protein [Phycisphaerales bacterium]
MRHAKASCLPPWGGLSVCLATVLVCGGCSSSPLSEESDAQLRRTVLESVRREAAEAQEVPELRPTTREAGGVERLGLSQAALDEIEKKSGPDSYRDATLPMGDNLLGRPQQVVAITLEKAIKSCVENNLELQFARIAPAISEAQLVQAEAAFDWTFFQNLTYNNVDEPRARTALAPSTTGLTSNVQNTVVSTTGLRQRLTTGGQLTVQQELTYTDDNTPGQNVFPDPNTALNVTAQLDQPLLRNFGSDVALAEVRLTRNAERNSIAQLKRDLIATINETEKTYWQLMQSHRDLLILQRLVEKGVQVRDQLVQRVRIDATGAQVADAAARVERRKGDLLQAQNILRQVSDKLKQLIHDPDLPVGGELLVIPLDEPIDAPIEFSLLDSIEQAIANRPEIRQAVLSMDDTSIRQTVAESGRLPQLDLRLLTRWWAIEENAADAYGDVFTGDFIDYIVGLAFEQPIGNRNAEAELRRRRLEKSQAVISYANTIEQVMLEVKGSLDNVTTNYALINQRRISRVAAAEVLRSLLVEKQTIAAYSVERLDLELNRQEDLAQAERAEVQALADYHTAIADLFAAMGTSLERNRIDFVVPNAEEVLVVRTPLHSKKSSDRAESDRPEPSPADARQSPAPPPPSSTDPNAPAGGPEPDPAASPTTEPSSTEPVPAPAPPPPPPPPPPAEEAPRP